MAGRMDCIVLAALGAENSGAAWERSFGIGHHRPCKEGGRYSQHLDVYIVGI